MDERFSPIPMIGRQDILDSIRQKIEARWGERNIICLFGAGGMGKTRMLQEVINIYPSDKWSIQDQQQTQDKKRIILIQYNGGTKWGQEFLAGVQEMANELNLSLESFDAYGNIPNMQGLLQEAITRPPDALLVREGSHPPIHNQINIAAQKGIPVLTFDNSSPDLHQSVTKLSHVNDDEVREIQKAAINLCEAIRYGGEIAIIRGTDDNGLSERREKIFRDVCQGYDNIQILETKIINPEKIEDIRDEVEAYANHLLLHNPNLRAFWTTWNAYARPLAKLLKNR